MTRNEKWDRIWINCHLATMTPEDAPYGIIENAVIAVRDGKIAWLGRAAELGGDPAGLAAQVINADGQWITPGLIDCHTHLVYGGNRANEFEMRLQGRSYAEIAGTGGGIVSTVRATRAASEEELTTDALKRLRALQREGVTTVEIKSGYGLNTETEIKMLKVARGLADHAPCDIVTTFLGAHALPPEYQNDSDGYVDHVCRVMLPEIAGAGLADAVDGFLETIAFTPEQIRRVFDAAVKLGLPVKLHADQLSDGKGAALAASFAALSADHLEYTGEDGLQAMAKSGTVAVLLPGAFYYLNETKKPPVQAFRDHNIAMAVATDCNPGSSPTASLLLMMNMAAVLFNLTAEEALAATTRHAARALGLTDRGILRKGLTADLAVWDIAHPRDLVYAFGMNPCTGRVKNGAPDGKTQ